MFIFTVTKLDWFQIVSTSDGVASVLEWSLLPTVTVSTTVLKMCRKLSED